MKPYFFFIALTKSYQVKETNERIQNELKQEEEEK